MAEDAVPAENVEVAEDSNVEASPAEETKTSETTQETTSEADNTQIDETATEETNEEVSERKPTRAERRIRQLSEENKQLRSQFNQPISDFKQPPQTVADLGDEITPEAYGQHVAQAAQSVVAPQIEQMRGEFETKEALSNFERDLEFIEKQYEELKEDSPIADVLEKQITEEFKQQAYRPSGFDPVTGKTQYRIDPSVRLADIAAQKVADARAIAEKASANIKNAVAKQADESAIRPSGSAAPDRDFKDLSIEEMEAKLGTVRQ